MLFTHIKCAPNMVRTGPTGVPGAVSCANTASSKVGTMAPRLKRPKKPPFWLDGHDDILLAAAENTSKLFSGVFASKHCFFTASSLSNAAGASFSREVIGSKMWKASALHKKKSSNKNPCFWENSCLLVLVYCRSNQLFLLRPVLSNVVRRNAILLNVHSSNQNKCAGINATTHLAIIARHFNCSLEPSNRVVK